MNRATRNVVVVVAVAAGLVPAALAEPNVPSVPPSPSARFAVCQTEEPAVPGLLPLPDNYSPIRCNTNVEKS